MVSPAEQYADHQRPHSPENQLESAVASSGPVKDGACSSCGRDIREGRELCETCEWVEEEMGIDLGRRENGAEAEEDPFAAALAEADPMEKAFEDALAEIEPRETAEPEPPDVADEEFPDGYDDRGIWEATGQGDLFPDVGNDWRREWRGMPEFQHRDETAAATCEVRFDDVESPELDPDESGGYGRDPGAIKVNFREKEDRERFAELVGLELYELKDGISVPSREEFSELVGQNIRDSTQSIWYPEAEIRKMSDKEYRVPPAVHGEEHQPKYPIFIPTVGRHGLPEGKATWDHLERAGVPYHLIVEEPELEEYAERVDESLATLLVLPERYQREYVTGDEALDGEYRETVEEWEDPPTGAGPARNFAWDRAADMGAARHWTMDDNLQGFYRYNDNLKTPCQADVAIRMMEDWCDRYQNVAMAGPRYFMFQTRKDPSPPLMFNTRIYSCNLIRTDLDYRWECRWNEDTDLSLRMLKDGWCTTIFNGFLQYKTPTQSMEGGNTDSVYAVDPDRRLFSEMLAGRHRHVVDVTHKWGRWHHDVDYSDFKGNELKRREDVDVEGMPRVDNRGMLLYVDGEPLSANPARTGAMREG